MVSAEGINSQDGTAESLQYIPVLFEVVCAEGINSAGDIGIGEIQMLPIRYRLSICRTPPPLQAEQFRWLIHSWTSPAHILASYLFLLAYLCHRIRFFK